MHILIDDQRPVEVTPIVMKSEEGAAVLVLSFEDTALILNQWVTLAPGRRNFRYGTPESDDDPSSLIIAEATNNTLDMVDIDPHYDGVETRNAYSYEELHAALPLKVVD